LENRVAERTADLEAKNKELETFTYSVSHDLKAPLRGIEGYSKLLVEDHAGQLDEEGLAFLNTIRSATNQMSRLIEDLLSYSRLERRSLTNDKVNIADMVTNLLNERKRDIQQRKIRVVNQIPDERVVIDQQAMNQALRNLIDNAIKFIRPESSPEIVFSLTSKSDVDILSISDNGIGFEMKFNEKIFDIFQRLHLADDYPGTGIGLALVKKAMQRMGGRVWAESEPGKGSTFYLEFPRGN
jgi:signal transduction histidine kinase